MKKDVYELSSRFAIVLERPFHFFRCVVNDDFLHEYI